MHKSYSDLSARSLVYSIVYLGNGLVTSERPPCHTSGMDSDERLKRFVLRARRIAAHSLASDRRTLAKLADFTMNAILAVDGSITIRRNIPDEEIFESLAARLRPVLLGSESIYLDKVLAAIDDLLERHASKTLELETMHSAVAELRDVWSRLQDPDLGPQRYVAQRAKRDGTEITPLVSDAQLAQAWFYGDLVHVDVKGKKKAGTLFPIRDRFAAAVFYFSDVALLCAEIYDVILALEAQGLLPLDEDVVATPVVLDTPELVETGKAFFAPINAEMPTFDISTGKIPEGFQQLTVTEALRMDIKNQVQVRLENVHGDTVMEYDAAVIRRANDHQRYDWDVLVAGCIIFELSYNLRDDGPHATSFATRVAKLTTNRMALDKSNFDRHLWHSSVIRFIVHGKEFIRVSLTDHSDESLRGIEASIESLEDLVTIEEITAQELPVPHEAASPRERVELRQIRLLWEGYITAFVRGPVTVKAAAGIVPEYVVIPSATRTFAGIQYPSPLCLLRHPQMRAESIQPIANSEPPQDTVQLIVPVNEPFVAWAPEKCDVTGDRDLLQPTPWGLSHFDASLFFGNGWSPEDGLTLGQHETD